MKDTLKCQVVLLPTNWREGVISIFKTETEETLSIHKLQPPNSKITATYNIPHHIYFISNNPIKEGNWFYNTHSKRVEKCTLIILKPKSSSTRDVLFKIEATTDSSLGLSLIPQSFIEEYIKEEGNIKEVELSLIIDLDNPPEGYYTYIPSGKYSYDEPYLMKQLLTNPDKEPNYKLLLNSNNEVIIHKSKESWNREEIKKLIQLYETTYISGNIDKWIEENLK